MSKEQLLNSYYDNGGKKLYFIVDKILIKFGGIYDKDKDDFYSVANGVMASIYTTYNNEQDFDAYVWSCLTNKIKTEITRRNREKRKCDVLSVSFETPIGDEGGHTVGDFIKSDFDLEKIVLREDDNISNTKIERYLDKLSKTQRKIVELLVGGYKPVEIQEIIHISSKSYTDNIKAIQSYEYVKILL